MTQGSFESRRAALGQALIPLSLFALVALVGGLVYHARSLESSHRATAENALRDYAALAAWQYNQQAETYLTNTAHMTLHVVHPLIRVTDRPLMPPDTIVHFGDINACGIGKAARFSFRIDFPSLRALWAGTAPDSMAQNAIVARFATIIGEQRRSGRETMRMLIDTIGGAPRVIAYGIAFGPDSLPRAVYGVEAGLASIVPELAEISTAKPLLPPSLLRGRPTDSLMMVSVRRADGGVLTSVGSASGERLAAELAMGITAGSLVTRVVIRPEAASTLLIGGVPASRINMLLLLLLGSVGLAGVALMQIRRGRELARLRTRFVANVSHELRTPLAQISMFSETLLLGRERSAAEGQQFLSIIFREARRLSHLVESVLRFSRSEAAAGTRPFHLELRDVSVEVRDAMRAFTPLAAAAGVELRAHLQDDAVARVEPDALRQVVLNLLDNAVKFGPEGQRVTVDVSRVEGNVVVAVTDGGPGIPASERRKVFEPFAQGANSQSRTTTGAGIGLSVVADIISAHGGRVWIDEGPSGRGARVSFALPATASVVHSPGVAPSPEHEPDAVLAAR
jgi:signal transduction histidine kinase